MSLREIWSPTLFTAWGIRVKAHLVLIVFLAAVLIQASLRAPPAVAGTAAGLGILFASVLLHELARAFAARRMGGEADEIVLWPLGGLSSLRIPQDPRAHFWTACWGPAANGLAALALGAWLWRTGGLDAAWGTLSWDDPWAVTAYRINLLICLFNLLPAFPLAGGQMLRAVLWPRLGFAEATRLSARVGKVAAVLLAVAGLVLGEVFLLLIGILNFVACEQERRLVASGLGAETEEPWAAGAEAPLREPSWLERRRQAGEARRIQARESRERRLRDRVDGILDKINRVGMQGLSDEERKLLKEASDVFKHGRK